VVSQLALAFDQPPPVSAETVFYLGLPPSREGLAAYTHLIRGPLDPEETKARGGGKRAPGWEKRLGSPEDWVEQIVALAKRPITFNAICVALTGATSDVLFCSAIDEALWLAVERGQLAWSGEAPIYFVDARQCTEVRGGDVR
jgi:hypothetical protein